MPVGVFVPDDGDQTLAHGQFVQSLPEGPGKRGRGFHCA